MNFGSTNPILADGVIQIEPRPMAGGAGDDSTLEGLLLRLAHCGNSGWRPARRQITKADRFSADEQRCAAPAAHAVICANRGALLTDLEARYRRVMDRASSR